MISFIPLLFSCLGLLIAYYHLFRRSGSSISKLPGPPSSSFIYGNFIEIFRAESGALYQKWISEYGPVIRFSVLYGKKRLATIDPKAINHILVKNPYDYPKPESVRGDLKRLLGLGILFSEGDDHKRQKRLLNPAFYPAQLRELTPLLFKIAYQLSSMWVDLVEKADDEDSKGYVLIDTLAWFNRATLDIIGLAGFGHNFESLEKEGQSELAKSFYTLTQSNDEFLKSGRLKFIVLNMMKKIPIIPDLLRGERANVVKNSLKVMEVESRKVLVKAQNSGNGQGESKDFISLLVRAIEAEKGTRDGMSDEEVMGQMTTFLFAGHETTATGLAWNLWALAKHPQAQEKLRVELLEAIKNGEASTEKEGIPISMDKLQALPYLDAFIREGMRLYPPVSSTIRVAAQDDQIPLSKPVRTSTGEVITSVPIRAGETVSIPIYAFNRSEEIFGRNSSEFEPERWLQGEAKTNGVGVWAGLLTFLAGPRACIGYRFALLEMKVILTVLVTRFKFEERDEGGGPEFERRGLMLAKPSPKGESKGNLMPIRVSLLKDQ